MKILVKSERLQEYLARKNISRTTFARSSGIHYDTVTKLLSGNFSPSPGLRKRLQAATDLCFDDLFLVITEN